MADFASLVNDVYTLTNATWLENETALAVKSATLKMHRSDFYFKDLFEVALEYSSAAYLQTIDYRTLFPRYRSLKYLRKLDSTGQNPTKFFDIITPEEILDSYKEERVDVCYVAGQVIQVKSSTADSFSLIGVYLLPDVSTAGNYKSWIADEAPMAVVYEAAAQIFGLMENNGAKNYYLGAAADEMLLLKQDNIQAKGY